MGSARTVVVEFVGLPATGKRHVAMQVMRRVDRAISPAGRSTSLVVRTTSVRRDAFTRLSVAWFLASRILRDPWGCLEAFRAIRETAQPNRWYELRYLAYLLYLVEEIRRARLNGEICLVDRGFYQHLWRIHLTGNADAMPSLTRIVDQYVDIVSPDIVVFLSVDHHTRMARAIERGTPVDAELLDPYHPLILDDREAYEDVRMFVPLAAHELGVDHRVIDIDNSADRLEENVETIARAILAAHAGGTEVSIEPGEPPFD